MSLPACPEGYSRIDYIPLYTEVEDCLVHDAVFRAMCLLTAVLGVLLVFREIVRIKSMGKTYKTGLTLVSVVKNNTRETFEVLCLCYAVGITTEWSLRGALLIKQSDLLAWHLVLSAANNSLFSGPIVWCFVYLLLIPFVRTTTGRK